jgi:hypothetical protein
MESGAEGAWVGGGREGMWVFWMTMLVWASGLSVKRHFAKNQSLKKKKFLCFRIQKGV